MLPADTTDLLPQKKPFKMVDTLLHVDETHIRTSFLVREDNVLISDDHFCEGGLIENMAQSIAAGTGYFFSGLNQDIPIGYIGAVKKVVIKRLPVPGDELQTEIHISNRFGNASIAEGQIFLQKELIASCELTIFVQQT